MRTWSIPAGRIFGVEIRIHVSFVLLLLFASLSQRGTVIVPNPGRGMALAGIIFVSVLLHELSHALMARRTGVAARGLIVFPICGVAVFEEPHPATAGSWRRDLLVSALNPLVYFLLAGAGALVLRIALPQYRFWTNPLVDASHLAHSFVFANLWLGFLNLLPGYPLDGGRVLRTLFSRRMDSVSATRKAVSIGRGFAIAFMLAGWWSLWFSLIGALLFIAAQTEDRSAVFQSVLDSVRLADIMLTDFATLSPADTLEDALEKAVHCLQDDFPVVRGGDMVGVVSKQKILQTLRSEGNGYVQAIMNRIFDVAPKSETLANAFRRLGAKNLSILPVVENQQLVGIVTLQNLMHSMALLAETRKLRKAAMES